MSINTAVINVSAPVYVQAGEHLNGATLASAEWVRSGRATVSIEKAEALERDGFADIVSKGGAAYTWGPCCDGSAHNHG